MNVKNNKKKKQFAVASFFTSHTLNIHWQAEFWFSFNILVFIHLINHRLKSSIYYTEF